MLEGYCYSALQFLYERISSSSADALRRVVLRRCHNINLAQSRIYLSSIQLKLIGSVKSTLQFHNISSRK